MKDREYLYALDSLRFFACLGIVTFHYNFNWAGYIFVEFFFVLGGFFLAHSFIYREAGKKSYGRYILDRISRLWPMQAFTLITYFVFDFTLHNKDFSYGGQFIFALFQQITLTHNIGVSHWGFTWNYANWYISVEFWVGAILASYISVRTKSVSMLAVAMICLVIISNQTGHLNVNLDNYFGFVNSGLLRGAASLLLGILSYRLYRRLRDCRISFLWGSLLQTGALLAIVLMITIREKVMVQNDFVMPFLFCATVLIFSLTDGVASKIISPISFLGKYSYSMYMNHLSVLSVLWYLSNSDILDRDKVVFLYYPILIIYSVATYYCIETHGKRLILRLHNSFTNQYNGRAVQAD